MESYSMDGVIEVGISAIEDAAHVQTIGVENAVGRLLAVLFGSPHNLTMWCLKRGTWVLWSLEQAAKFGPNATAHAVCDYHTEKDFLIPPVGGYVMVLTDAEAAIISDNASSITSPLVNATGFSVILHMGDDE